MARVLVVDDEKTYSESHRHQFQSIVPTTVVDAAECYVKAVSYTRLHQLRHITFMYWTLIFQGI